MTTGSKWRATEFKQCLFLHINVGGCQPEKGELTRCCWLTQCVLWRQVEGHSEGQLEGLSVLFILYILTAVMEGGVMLTVCLPSFHHCYGLNAPQKSSAET